MKNVLVVDDEPDIRQLLKEVLGVKLKNVTIDVASDGVEALNKIKTQQPDLLITDIYMPRIGGIELIEEIQKLKLHFPIIVISAFMNKISDLTLIKADAFVEKPLNLNKLCHTVENLFSS